MLFARWSLDLESGGEEPIVWGPWRPFYDACFGDLKALEAELFANISHFLVDEFDCVKLLLLIITIDALTLQVSCIRADHSYSVRVVSVCTQITVFD